MRPIDVAPPPPGQARLTGAHVLAMITAFFTLVAVVDIGMATMAYRTFSGEVAADPYEAGRLYNRTLAERRAQAALGWRAAIARVEGGDLQVSVADGRGQPVQGLRVSALLERPATEAGSRTLAFRSIGPGRYGAAAIHLSGAWDVTVRAVDGQGRPFEAQERFVWP